MSRSFRFNLLSIVGGIILLSLLIMAFLSLPALERYYVKSVEDGLEREARLLALLVKDLALAPGQGLQELAIKSSRGANTSITIVARNGDVLADSDYAPGANDNQGKMPEFRRAFAGYPSSVIRYNSDRSSEMLYVAVPVEVNGEIKGAVRTALPLEQVRTLQLRLLYTYLLAIAVALLAGIIATSIVSRKLIDPLSEITSAARDMANGNLKRRVHYYENDDIGKLAAAFNSMANSLTANISEISQVKNRLETVLDTTVNGVMLIDMRGRIEYINLALKRMLQIPEDSSLIGDSYLDITRSYEFTRLVALVSQKEERCSYEFAMYNRGEQLVEAQGVPVLDAQRKLKGILIILHDITRLKRLETVRKDFVANVSHELKTPVAAISGFAETLLNESDNPEAVTEFAGIIYAEAQRMDRMVKGLLELSRLETGSVNLRPGFCSLGSIAVEAGNLLRAKENEFLLAVEGDAEILVDHDLILQVFTNLFDNAIKYSLPPAKIIVNIVPENNTVKVEVEDRGAGIPAEEFSRIFERFYRVDKTRSRHTGGVGLGLSIVRHIVELHGGTVGVKSLLGQGSVFYFYLPRK